MILSFILALYRIYASFQLEHTRLDPNTKENIELAMGFIFGFVPFSILETPIRIFTRYDINFYDSYSLLGATLTTSIYAVFSIITIKCYHLINKEDQPHFIAASWEFEMKYLSLNSRNYDDCSRCCVTFFSRHRLCLIIRVFISQVRIPAVAFERVWTRYIEFPKN